jgi:hypothetical protein
MLSGMPVPELYRKHTEYAVGVKNSELGSNSTSTADPRKERFTSCLWRKARVIRADAWKKVAA